MFELTSKFWPFGSNFMKYKAKTKVYCIKMYHFFSLQCTILFFLKMYCIEKCIIFCFNLKKKNPKNEKVYFPSLPKEAVTTKAQHPIAQPGPPKVHSFFVGQFFRSSIGAERKVNVSRNLLTHFKCYQMRLNPIRYCPLWHLKSVSGEICCPEPIPAKNRDCSSRLMLKWNFFVSEWSFFETWGK